MDFLFLQLSEIIKQFSFCGDVQFTCYIHVYLCNKTASRAVNIFQVWNLASIVGRKTLL